MSKEQATDRKEAVIDIVKEVLLWVVVTALAFLWWMFVLLLISLFLVNVWHVTFVMLVRYGIVLTAVTSVVYGGKLVRRRLKG